MKDVAVRMVVSRVWKYDKDASDSEENKGMVIIPNGDTVLEEGEHVLVLCREPEVGVAEKLFGQTLN